jgi:hypothetical protein
MPVLTDRVVVLCAVALLAGCPEPDRSGTFEDSVMTADGSVAPMPDAGPPQVPDARASSPDAAPDAIDASAADAAGPDARVPADDASVPTDDASVASDAGEDAGSPFVCPESPVLVRASELPFVLAAGDLRLTILTLEADAAFGLCVVPSESLPGAVASDAPLGDVYAVQTDAATFAGRLERSLDEALLTAMDVGGGRISPLVPRVHTTGAARHADNAALMLDEQVVRAQLSAPGFVYFRHLDASGPRYAVTHAPPAEQYLTGEVIPYGVQVDVLGTPAALRSIELTHTGCNVEPIGPESPVQSAACGARESVTRHGESLPHLGILAADSTLDMLASPDAASFFCPFAGTGEVSLALAFTEERARVLTVHTSAPVRCTPSFDLLLAANRLSAASRLHGPIVPTFMPTGSPLPLSEVRFSSAAFLSALQPLGADGVWHPALTSAASVSPTAELSVEAPLNSARLAWDGDDYVPTYAEAKLPAREPGLSAIDAPYYPESESELLASRESSAVDVLVGARAAHAVTFGVARGPATEISFAEGSVDAVYVQGLGDAENGASFARFIRPTDLPLAHGRRSFSLLTSVQAAEVATQALAITRYRVGFLNVSWDERRDLWPGGRVMPVAGGTVYELEAAAIAEPGSMSTGCRPSAVDEASGCRRGPREVLLVASGGKVESFSPVDGSYLGTLVEAGGGRPDGFVHVVQSPSNHCLYASQHSSAHGNGIFRYDHVGTLAELDPLSLKGAERPYGLLGTDLFFAGDLWLITRPAGVLMVDGTGHVIDAQDSALSARGVEIGPGGVYASGKLSGDATGSVRLLSGGEGGNTASYFITGLAGPEQLVYDPAETGRLLVALADQPAVAAYDFDTRGPLLFIDDVYTDEHPRGVYPLLNGQWLVAGDGLGVDVLMPGTHVRYPSDTQVSDDSAYISRVCLPE